MLDDPKFWENSLTAEKKNIFVTKFFCFLDYNDHPPTSESPPTQDKVLGHKGRPRKTAKRGHPRSKSEVDTSSTNMHVHASPTSTNHICSRDPMATILHAHTQRQQRTLIRYSDFPSVKKFVSLQLSSGRFSVPI